MRALGVDVSVSRGLDLVLLDDARRVVTAERRCTADDLASRLRDLRPDVVAIDSPPCFGISGQSRQAERDLLARRIQIFATPSDPEWCRRPFYDWMRAGHRSFEVAAAAGYPLHRSGGPVRGCAIEVFPHASAVVLKGMLPPQGYRKRAWRRDILVGHGVEVGPLTSLDQIDAALAALTGLFALRDQFIAVGDPAEGVIVLPGRTLPDRFAQDLGPSRH